MSRRLVTAFLALATLSIGLPSAPVAFADLDGSIRLYKLNSKGQFVRQRWVSGDEEPGCHDFRGTREVNRFAQVGFAWCTVYGGDECAPGTEIAAMWRGGDYRSADIDVAKPQVRLLPGSQWYFHESKNVEMGSWECRYAN